VQIALVVRFTPFCDGHGDIGVRADIGDGFGGLRFDYYRLDQGTTQSGVIDADWGRLQNADTVQMRAAMDEFRIGYLEPFLHVRTTYRDRPLQMRVAAGGVFSHRDLALRASNADRSRTQDVDIDGDMLYAAARFRATWRDFAFDLDYAISPDVVLGGDFDGVLQDAEVRASYTMPLNDITFFAGYRYSQLDASGTTNGFGYDADLTLDGYQFGVAVTF
jgi:hypothetical protein